MAFVLPKGCREFFTNIFDASGKNTNKLRLQFDEYYFCLMAGLAYGKYENSPKLDEHSQIDAYPNEYQECQDYIAGLLIATEAELRGVDKTNAFDLETVMVEFIDSTSRTKLNANGEKRLNQYASRGMDLLQQKMSGKPYKLEVFLQEYYRCFSEGEFLAEKMS